MLGPSNQPVAMDAVCGRCPFGVHARVRCKRLLRHALWLKVAGRIGFSRAVRVGQIVAVSGTAPIAEDGSVACPGEVYGQTRRCLEVIAQAVADVGLSLDTVVRTRIMLTDVSLWEAAARAHGEFFAAIRPATTFIEVQGFINREWLVEVEADCVADR
jgi:enamine deaminase RidA (YjgF/YER057c/UK114 family)